MHPPSRECYVCKKVLPREHFSRSPSNLDGILHMCRPCNAERSKKWRLTNPERYRKKQREAARTAKGRARGRRGAKIQQKRNRLHVNARVRLQAAIRRGAIVRMPCEVCGTTKVHGHHDDYLKPFEVRWLCEPHHREVHRLLKAAKESISPMEQK